ncbi:MAG: SusC/RagA family TonB-linked outer membrane protein [Sediminibacterium sp.]|nr:SusC/RagA family TonB-linked outer membrane protein [Sediminibacterium sp.]
MKKLCKPFFLLLLMGFTLFQTSALHAQRIVSGKVVDAKGNPIESVTVKFSKSDVSAQTDAKGEFNISVSGDGELIFSSVQHATKKVALTPGNSVYQVTLQEKTEDLTDVVVTGYTSQSRKDIAGAVVSVRPADLSIQNTSSPLASAQGLAPGVNITTDGQPGSNPTVLIRGISSLSLRNTPLYIIDGVQTTDLSDFNQNDIESFQVLKDAATTSQYGSRANAGVIIITTKKGAKGTPKVSYQGYLSIQDPLKGLDLLNPQEDADLLWFQARNLALTSGLPYANPSSPQYGNGNTPVLPDYTWYLGTSGYTGPVDLTKYNFPSWDGLIIKANKQGTNWYSELFKPALQQVHNLSVSGGGPNARFYLGLGYFNQPGVLLNTKYERYNITLNSEFTIKKRIRIGESFLFSFANRNGIANQDEGNAVSYSWRIKPIVPVYDISGENFAGGLGGLGSAANPVAYRYWARNDYNHNYNIRFNLYGEVDFLRYFTFKTQLSGTQNFNTFGSYRHETYENPEIDFPGLTVVYGNGWSQNRSLTYLNTLRFKIDIKEDHHINALLGIEAVTTSGGFLNATNSNYYTDALNYVVLNSGGNVARASGSDPDPGLAGAGNLFSYFGIFQYNYKEKYIVAANLRNDGSSVFKLGSQQYGTFPGIQIAWVASSEPWLQYNKVLSNLKLRTSYGQTGNQSIPYQNPFTLFALSYANAYYDLAGTGNSLSQGFYLTQYGGPNTTWETKEDLNFGIDLGFLNKISITADYFISNSNNLLYQVPLNSTTQGNAVPPFLNTGSVRNTGIELSIGYRNDDHKFKYNIQANLSSYKNEITALTTYGPNYIDAGGWRQGSFVRNQVGNPISSFFGYKVIGFFNTKAEADAENAASGNNEAAIGRYKYADINGDGKITGEDRTFIGNPNPQFIYGLNVNLSYVGFDLNLQFYGVQGKDVVNYASWWTDGNNFVGAKSKDALYNSWTPTNTNARLPINDGQTSFYSSNVFNSSLVEDGSYLRLKNFTFGYSIPNKILSKGGIEKVRFYIQATNLFTITNYRGLDPEFQGVNGSTGAFGIDYGNYRTPAAYTFGVQFGF